MNFTHLNVKSHYTLLDSLLKVDDIVDLSLSAGFSACAICDVNTVYGLLELYFKSKDLKCILGMEVKYGKDNYLLYAKSYLGLQNIFHISSLINADSFVSEDILKYGKDIVIVFTDQTKLYDDYMNNSLDIEEFKNFYNVFGEIYYNGENLEFCKTFKLKKLSNKIIKYNEVTDEKYYNLLKNIEANTHYVKSVGKGVNSFQLYDTNVINEEMINTSMLIDSCNVVIPNELLIPKFDKRYDSFQLLYSICKKGLEKRIGSISEEYYNRLKHELRIINDMKFSDYFLMVYDYVKFAKNSGIYVGAGRGSAAGSLVAYVLGITEIDPIKYGLLFERFLNPQRVTYPDIDIDFEDVRRDEVIEYIVQKYGMQYVGVISTFSTFASKQVLRDVAKAFGKNNTQIKYLVDDVSPLNSLKDNYKFVNSFAKKIDSDSDYLRIYSYALKIEGLVRHTSTHAAGVVISNKELSSITGVVENDNYNVIQTSMNYIENIGLIKMDILGLRNLSIIHNVVNSIKSDLGLVVDFNNIDLNDEKVLKLFCEGKTTGIFQFESEGMIKLLKAMKPDKFLDLAAANALHRPGPMENIDEFVFRKHGKKYDVYVDDLTEILDETYGIIVYQEQIMQIARIISSFDFARADLLRRAMSKKNFDALDSQKELFVQNGVANGYDEEVVKQVFELILKFANYGFNKAHAVSYAYIGYTMAYLKCYYPQYFYLELLNNSISNSSKVLKYINECRVLDIELVGVSVNESSSKFIITDSKLILPLNLVSGLSKNISEIIINERKHGLFESFIDFVRRVYPLGVNEECITALIYVKAFNDCSNETISTQISSLHGIINSVSFGDYVNQFKYNEVEEFSLNELILNERRYLGFNFNNHPTSLFPQYSNVNSSNLSSYLHKNVTIVLYTEGVKVINTKNGESMSFVSTSDLYGDVNLVLFPRVHSSVEIMVGDLLLVNGNVEYRNESIQIIVNNVKVRR